MREGCHRFRRVFFPKIPSKTIAFVFYLLYSLFCFSCSKDLGFLRKKMFFSYFSDFFLEDASFFYEIVCFFKGFLRVKYGFWGLLNTALPFQHRNKIGFLCVT